MKVKLDPGAICPTRAHKLDAGLDLYATCDKVVPAHGSAIFDTGVHVELPPFTAGFLKSKSGLNVKHNITSDSASNFITTEARIIRCVLEIRLANLW